MSEEIRNDQSQNNEQSEESFQADLAEQRDLIEQPSLGDSLDRQSTNEAATDHAAESNPLISDSEPDFDPAESSDPEPDEIAPVEIEPDEIQPAPDKVEIGEPGETEIDEPDKVEIDEPGEIEIDEPGEIEIGEVEIDSLAIEDDESSAEPVDEASAQPAAQSSNESIAQPVAEIEEEITATRDEIKPVIESLLFVADEPLPFKQLCKVLGHVAEEDVKVALDELAAEYETRSSGLEVREIAGGWRLSTRPQNHEFIRKYLKSRPSARLSLPALETLAVIAYKQPVTVPEVLEIRGVSSSSAIKTLLEKRLIVTKGRKETVGRPMLYGTSKEFLIQFGLKDLSELPSIEDFEDLSQ